MVVAGALLGEEVASAIISSGSLASADDAGTEPSRFGSSRSPPMTISTAIPLPLQILVGHAGSAPSTKPPTVVLTIDVPSIHAEISKSLLDGLQLWADDVSQLVERKFGGGGETDTDKAESRNPSLIGSRFFAQSRRYGNKSSEESGNGFSDPPEVPSEAVIKVAVSEGSTSILLRPELSCIC
jgi:autophagy-related protein 2